MAEHTRTLDFKIAFAIGLGTMIAAGIFSLSGTAVFRIGSTAVLAFVLAAVVAGITAAAYSEFASIYSENGGGYLFTSRTFEDRPVLTYAIGMMLFVGYTGTTAFYLATMDEWFFGFLVPRRFQFLPPGTFGLLAAVSLGVLNARGTEESGTFQLLVTAAKVAVLLIFIGGMFASVGMAPALAEFTTAFQPEPIGTVSVAALAFITFFGFSAIAASAGEIIDPRTTVPRAIGASILTVTVLYTFVIVAMVNIENVAGRLARSPDEILQLGETAMGAVAQAFIPVTVAGVPVGKYLIVAGAIFSMVSASNASILAASGIGSLMGRRGQAPRRFVRIHTEYGTPFWSVTTATATIVTLIVAFITLFGHHGALAPVHVGLSATVAGVSIAVNELSLGLTALTGFATLNLLLPLAVVNVVLVFHRRKFPDAERGFRVPGVPLVPALGVVANLALIYNLPTTGIVVGLGTVAVLLAAFLVWGGSPAVDELVREVVGARTGRAGGTDGSDGRSDRPDSSTRRSAGNPTDGDPGRTDAGEDEEVAAGEASPGEASPGEASPGEGPPDAAQQGEGPPDAAPSEEAEDHVRVLVPIARPSHAPGYVALGARLGRAMGETVLVQLVNVTQIPDQTPHEMVARTAADRVERLRETVAEAENGVDAVEGTPEGSGGEADVDVYYTIEGHTCRDVAFDIVQTARTDGADLILMGYPEDHPTLTESVEYEAPCDVVFVSGFDLIDDMDVLTVGAGGGPHHEAALGLVRALGATGAAVHVVTVDTTGEGTVEDPGETVSELDSLSDVHVRNVTASSVAAGLVDSARENGGVLLIGASRDRRLRQWVFGSTPDRVVELARAEGVPVLVYASAGGVPEWIEDHLFPLYRYARKLIGRERRQGLESARSGGRSNGREGDRPN